MTSFNHRLTVDERETATLVGDIHHLLNEALSAAGAESGMTQQKLAERLGIDKAAVSRRFNGAANLKLETIAVTLAALGRRLVVGVERLDARRTGSNFDAVHMAPVASVHMAGATLVDPVWARAVNGFYAGPSQTGRSGTQVPLAELVRPAPGVAA